jgi:hypothetical protein
LDNGNDCGIGGWRRHPLCIGLYQRPWHLRCVALIAAFNGRHGDIYGRRFYHRVFIEASVMLISFICGLIFGVGLIISGMANPAKVLGFLDLAGTWDPSLAFVMAGAVDKFPLRQICAARVLSSETST